MNEWNYFTETETPAGAGGQPRPAEAGKPVKSMHEYVPDWYDCCACEAEPYWLAAMGEEPGGEPDCDGGGAEP